MYGREGPSIQSEAERAQAACETPLLIVAWTRLLADEFVSIESAAVAAANTASRSVLGLPPVTTPRRLIKDKQVLDTSHRTAGSNLA